MEQTASWAQRVLALLVDWGVSTLAVIAVIGPGGWLENDMANFYVLGVFVFEATVLTALMGGSFGKLVLRLRVVRFDASGRPVGLLHCLLRQVMVALVIPPLVYRPDGRGLHDIVAGTVTMTLRSLQRPST
ncbi:RDD family protein [Nocardioides alcanivorans]|uniref:RDD family protein n=1 Tax=Nocardioides alcanivorans TaxID=2897352 RepID=UPI001F2E7707|nr:RDD family protein [Nocardioides alcanivorans]